MMHVPPPPPPPAFSASKAAALSSVVLRPYQSADEAKIFAAWLTHQTVLLRADTGYGKTAVIGSTVSRWIAEARGSVVVIAHRDSIVAQLSLMLARFGIRHNIIAAEKNVRQIAALHVAKTGRSYLDPGAKVSVASVDTLVKRNNLSAWAASITLAVVDEGHHVIVGNKWHTALSNLINPALKILLPTATPKRADNKGLGRSSDGIADVMVLGPPMRWLMDQGYLTEYYPPIIADSHLTEALGKVGSSGDWSIAQQRSAAMQSTIVGDVPETYRKVNAGEFQGIPAAPFGRPRLALVFASDVETAKEILAEFRRTGVAAELLTGDTDAAVRLRVFQDFEARKISVIIAVDIISEGTDIPAVEVVILARSTASLSVYMQQIGRGLRPLWSDGLEPSMAEMDAYLRLASIAASSKPKLIIIDHVGNFLRHGPPDRERPWSLDRGASRASGPSDAIPSRACLNPVCAHPYPRVLSQCPHCLTPAPPPASRDGPELVDGEMVLLDPEVLKSMLGDMRKATASLDDYRAELAASGLPQKFIWANAKRHAEHIPARTALREIMEYWGGRPRAMGLTDNEIQKLFWFKFRVDVISAYTLNVPETETLIRKITEDLLVPLEL